MHEPLSIFPLLLDVIMVILFSLIAKTITNQETAIITKCYLTGKHNIMILFVVRGNWALETYVIRVTVI